MKDYTAPSGLIYTPTEQCILYAFYKYYEKIKYPENTGTGSVEAVVARLLSAPSQNIGPMMRYLQEHEQLQLEDVIYSLGDFKDFDEWISYVCELELRKERSIRPQEQAKASSVVRVEAAHVEQAVGGAAELDDVDEGWCLVVA